MITSRENENCGSAGLGHWQSSLWVCENDTTMKNHLTELITTHYTDQPVSLTLIPTDWGQMIYRVEQADQPRWILRVYPPSQSQKNLLHLATLLWWLEQQHYPAERLIRTLHGEMMVVAEGWQLLLTTFLEGTPIDYTPTALYPLGAAAGRLHALDLPTSRDQIPQAKMLPARELAYAVSQLNSVKQCTPKHLYRRYETLLAAIEGIQPCEPLPQVIIHNDFHPGNALLSFSGNVALLDWEGAGWGPAILDIGFLLISCETPSPWAPRLMPDQNRMKAIIDGYCQHHRLTVAELDYLPDAMRFRSLVYGAGHFARAIRRGIHVDEASWWWRRYLASEGLAERARKHLEKAL